MNQEMGRQDDCHVPRDETTLVLHEQHGWNIIQNHNTNGLHADRGFCFHWTHGQVQRHYSLRPVIYPSDFAALGTG
jgi:hypothetical protein